MEQDRQNPSPYWERPRQGSRPSNNTPGQGRPTNGPFWNRPGQTSSDSPSQQPYCSKEEQTNKMAFASMILGILALLGILAIYPAIIFGSLSIILALLSRGKSLKMHSQAQSGVITSVIALGCDLAMFAMVFVLIFGMPDFFESIYGMSYQEMMEQIEDGTLDYDELYNNIYNNLEDNRMDDRHENPYSDLYDYLPKDTRDKITDILEDTQ
jgi:hypothetical protein